MPVSKKRKKDGKPVQAHTKAHAEGEHAGPDEKAQHPALRAGKPSNPFVAKQMTRSAQRGR